MGFRISKPEKSHFPHRFLTIEVLCIYKNAQDNITSSRVYCSVWRFSAGRQPRYPSEYLIAAGILSPQRGLTISPWRGRDTLPSIYRASVIILPERSTAFTCRFTEFCSLILCAIINKIANIFHIGHLHIIQK